LTGSTTLRFTVTGPPLTDESACLTAGNIRNEVVTIHGSHEVLKILLFYTYIRLLCFFKKTQVQ
jgi:hypothetical protein